MEIRNKDDALKMLEAATAAIILAARWFSESDAVGTMTAEDKELLRIQFALIMREGGTLLSAVEAGEHH